MEPSSAPPNGGCIWAKSGLRRRRSYLPRPITSPWVTSTNRSGSRQLHHPHVTRDRRCSSISARLAKKNPSSWSTHTPVVRRKSSAYLIERVFHSSWLRRRLPKLNDTPMLCARLDGCVSRYRLPRPIQTLTARCVVFYQM